MKKSILVLLLICFSAPSLYAETNKENKVYLDRLTATSEKFIPLYTLALDLYKNKEYKQAFEAAINAFNIAKETQQYFIEIGATDNEDYESLKKACDSAENIAISSLRMLYSPLAKKSEQKTKDALFLNDAEQYSQALECAQASLGYAEKGQSIMKDLVKEYGLILPEPIRKDYKLVKIHISEMNHFIEELKSKIR